MQVQAALFFETVEQIYARVFQTLRPRAALPEILVRFRKYANANSRIRLAEGRLRVDLSDLLQTAPAPIQEALATVLLGKLFGSAPDKPSLAQYRRYLNRSDVRLSIHSAKRERGRKTFRAPNGRFYDLTQLFESLNSQYFNGELARPALGWSVRASRAILGHYDPSHNMIVLSGLLDSPAAPEIAVSFVLFHEMLHVLHPIENRGARRCVHTATFKKAEKAFVGYAAAKAQLMKFVRES